MSSNEETFTEYRSMRNESASDDNVSATSDSDTSDDEIPANPKRNARRIIESDDDEDVDEEKLCYSPRTRMSMTGVRPVDLTSDSEEDEDGDEKDSTSYGENSEDDLEPSDNSYIDNCSESNRINSKELSNKSSVTIEETSDESDQSYEPVAMEFGNKSNDNASLSKHNSSNGNDKITKDVYDASMVHDKSQIINDSVVDMSINQEINCNDGKSIMEVDVVNKSQAAEDSDECVFVPNTIVTIDLNPSPTAKLNSTVNDFFKLPTVATSTPTNTKKFKQPKLTTMITKEIFVSQEFYNKELQKLKEKELELKKAKELAETLGPKLPDNGRRMSGRINMLENEIELQLKKITELVVQEALPTTDNKPTTNCNPIPSWDELNADANLIQPRHTGKIGMANFNAGKALTIDRLKDIHGSLATCPNELVLAEQPDGFNLPLMEHQLHAIAWMTWRESQKPRGGILADDMGLGKTLTVIALILKSNESSENNDDSSDSDKKTDSHKWTSKGRKDYYKGKNLVICPASLIGQWENEAKNRVKRRLLNVVVHHGTNRETRPRFLSKCDLVVTTYNIVSNEKKHSGALFGVEWNRIILDEAHVIRNHKSLMSESVCALKGKYRWTLTGTPVQNKEQDVYALLKFLKCSPFDDLAHWKKWIDNKSAGGQQRLNTLMTSLMLRRTKAQLLLKGQLGGLPEKEVQLIDVNLEKDEMNVYQKIMVFSKSLFAQYLYQRAAKASEFQSQPFRFSKDPNGVFSKAHKRMVEIHGQKEVKSHEILVLLLRLRQICCHPGLITAMLEEESNQSLDGSSCDEALEIDLMAQLDKLELNDFAENINDNQNEAISKASSKVLLRTNPVFDLSRSSSKMKKVLEILKQKVLDKSDKAVIVSQWTSVLNILSDHLNLIGIRFVLLTGNVPVKSRQDIIDEFNRTGGPQVMLLSLTAGGVGLNLVGGNHLLLMDIHWNPQLEAQAQDRIYRVGQKKKVFVYKFVCLNTVEQRIKALQDHKLAIADGILTGRMVQGSKLTMDDLKSLFGM